jgi:hypothetical protein
MVGPGWRLKVATQSRTLERLQKCDQLLLLGRRHLAERASHVCSLVLVPQNRVLERKRTKIMHEPRLDVQAPTRAPSGAYWQYPPALLARSRRLFTDHGAAVTTVET